MVTVHTGTPVVLFLKLSNKLCGDYYTSVKTIVFRFQFNIPSKSAKAQTKQQYKITASRIRSSCFNAEESKTKQQHRWLSSCEQIQKRNLVNYEQAKTCLGVT
jgi:hypothetical protein